MSAHSDQKVSGVHVCNKCNESFDSRNKLFVHIRTCPLNPNALSNFSKKAKDGKEDCEEEEEDEINAPLNIPQEPIRIVQEDENWYRVIVKPQGMATMGMVGHETLHNSPAMLILPARIKYKKATPCHRLDRATGGLVLCSKSKAAESSLTGCFRLHEVKKRYRAIVSGQLDQPEGIIDTPIDGMPSETRYKVALVTPSRQYGHVTTVDLWPITGRKHQLRKHLLGIGHPILGDHRYTSALVWPLPPYTHTLFLWALEISFPHKGAPLNTTETSATSETSPNTNTQEYPMIRVEIPEPTYYEEFRRSHALQAETV